MGLLDQLGECFTHLDKDDPYTHRMVALLDRIKTCQAERHKNLLLLREAVESLRVNVKYMTFDLEATRQERDALKNG